MHQDRLESAVKELGVLIFLNMKRQENGFVHVVGRINTLRDAAETLGRAFIKGMTFAERLFPQAH